MHTMQQIVDLERYPLDRPESREWAALVHACKAKLASDGLFNLPGFVLPRALSTATESLKPVFNDASFLHERAHNIYFKKTIPGLHKDHPALRLHHTTNHTICADQMRRNAVIQLYEWPEFAVFLAAVMGKTRLYTMADPLARVNVMAYHKGEALNWHFDRSEFTTTLLLQEPETGGAFEYAKDLRTESDPNYDGVADLFEGKIKTTVLPLKAGTLNIFRGKNTAHRVTPVHGYRERIIAVFSYFERQGVVFSDEERLGFYGRVA